MSVEIIFEFFLNYTIMGRNIDRGLEDRNEKQRGNDSNGKSKTDKVKEKTREELSKTLRGK